MNHAWLLSNLTATQLLSKPALLVTPAFCTFSVFEDLLQNNVPYYINEDPHQILQTVYTSERRNISPTPTFSVTASAAVDQLPQFLHRIGFLPEDVISRHENRHRDSASNFVFSACLVAKPSEVTDTINFETDDAIANFMASPFVAEHSRELLTDDFHGVLLKQLPTEKAIGLAKALGLKGKECYAKINKTQPEPLASFVGHGLIAEKDMVKPPVEFLDTAINGRQIELHWGLTEMVNHTTPATRALYADKPPKNKRLQRQLKTSFFVSLILQENTPSAERELDRSLENFDQIDIAFLIALMRLRKPNIINKILNTQHISISGDINTLLDRAVVYRCQPVIDHFTSPDQVKEYTWRVAVSQRASCIGNGSTPPTNSKDESNWQWRILADKTHMPVMSIECLNSAKTSNDKIYNFIKAAVDLGLASVATELLSHQSLTSPQYGELANIAAKRGYGKLLTILQQQYHVPLEHWGNAAIKYANKFNYREVRQYLLDAHIPNIEFS